MLKKRLFQIAKHPLMGNMVGLAFQYCGRVIPVEKVYCSRDVLAFVHPSPCYENHIVLSPRKPIRNLRQLSEDRFSRYFAAVWQAAQDIQAARFAPGVPFVLMANGGKKQEVQQVHFHLFTNHEMVCSLPVQALKARFLRQDDVLAAAEHPASGWDCHFVLLPVSPLCAANQAAVFKSLLQSIAWLDAKFHMAENGCSLIFQRSQDENRVNALVFHFVSGKRKNATACFPH